MTGYSPSAHIQATEYQHRRCRCPAIPRHPYSQQAEPCHAMGNPWQSYPHDFSCFPGSLAPPCPHPPTSTQAAPTFSMHQKRATFLQLHPLQPRSALNSASAITANSITIITIAYGLYLSCYCSHWQVHCAHSWYHQRRSPATPNHSYHPG